MKRNRIAQVSLAGVAVAVTVIVAVAVAAETPGASYDDWTRRRDIVAKDAMVVRYYTFEGVQAAADPIPNLAGDKSEPLLFKMEPKAGAPKDDFKLVDGRWPTKKAVRLDQGYLYAKPADVSDKAFTAVLWFRKNGQGAHRGNNGTTNGMLLAVGNGYWEGWRLTTWYPDRHIGFEIGRPQPSSAIGISTEAVADGAWHHLAATWDGKEMRVYVNGALAASGAYSGAYTPPKGGQFRVGFADSGIGSVVLDVDELVLYSRALSAEEVFRDVYFHASFPDDLLARLAAVNTAAAKKDFASAEKELAALLKTEGLHRDLASALRLQLGDLLRKQGNGAAAAAEFGKVLDTPDLPPRVGKQALEKLLALLKEGAGASLPRALCDRLLAMPELGPTERLSLRLSLGHSLAAAKDFAAARAEYLKIADAQDVSPQWRSLAQLCAAQASVRAKDYAQARAAYEKVKAIPGGPRHHAWEADERIREIERLEAGKPARDPLASRVQLAKRPAPGLTLYVAPDGKDTDVGSKDKPFATLERARDEIRAVKQKGALPAGGVTVLVAGGEYRIKDTFKLSADDSGTKDAPVVYCAASTGGDARATFNGGVRIGGFQPVRDEAVLARLPEESRGKVMQTYLKAQGIADFGKFEPGGFNSGRGFKTHPLLELYVDGQPMPFSRWPNEGYVRIADVPAKGRLKYTDERPKRWKDEKDLWLYGYWFHDWADSYEKVASLDTEKREITLAPPLAGYGYRKNQRFCAVNLLCEIDRPGEWYLDRDTGILYFYPPNDPRSTGVSPVALDKALIEVSMLEKPLVELDGVSYVSFEGLLWENGRGDAISIKGGESCLLAGCTIRKFGGNAVTIDGGVKHGVLSCDIHTLGRGGMVVSGGDRKTLSPSGHFIENCHVHHLSRIDHTYTPCVLLNGVGNRIAHNLFHDNTSSAMRVEGNDHVIEYNEIRRVLLESDDQGGADMWGNPTYRGNVYRYNYWHDMGNGLGCGQAGIRLDDAICGTVIYGNIFQRCADGGFGGVQIHGGKENWVENNLFVECKAAVSFSAWGAGRWKSFLDGEAKKHIQEVKPTEPPYVTRYPELARLYENCDSSNIWRNVVLNCGSFLLRDPGRNDLMDNWLVAENPGFADPGKNDFTMKDGSALANRLSFQPIPFGEIGMYADDYRKGK
ncbi:MAG: right-handed parallel beta-helix repeat-containing protein [Planctomycetota bacterium]|nr:right-handed parallel beta-helix repeat-containing protein [Planctomycetota bacterium]